MDDHEFGFFSYKMTETDYLYYFGHEVDISYEIENRLTELSKQVLTEIGLESFIDTLEVQYIDLDSGTDDSVVYIVWSDSEKQHFIRFISTQKFGQEEFIYKDGKYRAMVFYSMPDGIRDIEKDFMNALVKKCPLNK